MNLSACGVWKEWERHKAQFRHRFTVSPSVASKAHDYEVLACSLGRTVRRKKTAICKSLFGGVEKWQDRTQRKREVGMTQV
jgi:hypothetical protein